MEFKGTKGNWQIGIAFQGETENIKIKTNGQLLTIEDCNNTAVAIVGRIGESVQESNAKLIASCPALFDALSEAINLLYGTTEFEVIERYRAKINEFEELLTKITE